MRWHPISASCFIREHPLIGWSATEADLRLQGESSMLLFCKKCGRDTEQNYLGMSLNPPRIASRCPKCGETNFNDSWKVHSENNRMKQEAIKAKLAAQAGSIPSCEEEV